MQVKATAPATVPAVSVPCSPLDFEVTGPAVVRFAAVVSLSLEDLVAALLLAGVSTEELTAMTAEQVRREVAWAVAAYGLTAVHETVHHEANARFDDADVTAHKQLCAAKVATAFDPAALAPATRSRAASRSIGTRRTLVKVAA